MFHSNDFEFVMSSTILCFDSLCIQLSSKRFPWQSLFIIVASLTPVSFYKCAASQKWNTDSVFAKYVLIYCSIWFYWNVAIIWSKKCYRHLVMALVCDKDSARLSIRPARIAELPRSKFDPELFPHSAYVEIFVTFATKVPYLTFCNKMWCILM